MEKGVPGGQLCRGLCREVWNCAVPRVMLSLRPPLRPHPIDSIRLGIDLAELTTGVHRIALGDTLTAMMKAALTPKVQAARQQPIRSIFDPYHNWIRHTFRPPAEETIESERHQH